MVTRIKYRPVWARDGNLLQLELSGVSSDPNSTQFPSHSPVSNWKLQTQSEVTYEVSQIGEGILTRCEC